MSYKIYVFLEIIRDVTVNFNKSSLWVSCNWFRQRSVVIAFNFISPITYTLPINIKLIWIDYSSKIVDRGNNLGSYFNETHNIIWLVESVVDFVVHSASYMVQYCFHNRTKHFRMNKKILAFKFRISYWPNKTR